MEFYHMECTPEDAQLIINAVNQGIDAHLQAVTDSTFEVVDKGIWGKRLACDIAPNDLRVIIRRLLESDDDTIEDAENLVSDIVGTLGIDELWLCTEDRFYITLDEGYYFEDTQFWAWELAVPYVSIFDDAFWPRLFEAQEVE